MLLLWSSLSTHPGGNYQSFTFLWKQGLNWARANQSGALPSLETESPFCESDLMCVSWHTLFFFLCNIHIIASSVQILYVIMHHLSRTNFLIPCSQDKNEITRPHLKKETIGLSHFKSIFKYLKDKFSQYVNQSYIVYTLKLDVIGSVFIHIALAVEEGSYNSMIE